MGGRLQVEPQQRQNLMPFRFHHTWPQCSCSSSDTTSMTNKCWGGVSTTIIWADYSCYYRLWNLWQILHQLQWTKTDHPRRHGTLFIWRFLLLFGVCWFFFFKASFMKYHLKLSSDPKWYSVSFCIVQMNTGFVILENLAADYHGNHTSFFF